MAANDTQRMWLHDESKTVNVLPYTTVDSIKIRDNVNNLNIDTYTDFETDYNSLKSAITAANQSFTNSINQLSNRIDSIDITQSVATHSSDGLMSKEDKVKLDLIDEGSMEYQLEPATANSLGGIRVGNTLTIDGNGILNATLQSRGLESLNNVVVNQPADGQILAYDNTNSKWVNQTLAGVSSINDIGDVNLNSNLQDNHFLKYVLTNSGGYWTNGEITFSSTTLNAFSDVQITSPAAGDLLIYDATTNKWENAQVNLSKATASADGLMSKEHFSKLENIAANANNYVLPEATASSLGGVKVDGTTITIDNNGVISSTGGNSDVGDLEDLNDVNLTTPTDGQALIYDSTNSEWVNGTISGSNNNDPGTFIVNEDNLLVDSSDRDYNVTIDITDQASTNIAPSWSYDSTTGIITINGDLEEGENTAQQLCSFDNNGDFFNTYLVNKKFVFGGIPQIDDENLNIEFFIAYSGNYSYTDYIYKVDKNNPSIIVEFKEDDYLRTYNIYVKITNTYNSSGLSIGDTDSHFNNFEIKPQLSLYKDFMYLEELHNWNSQNFYSKENVMDFFIKAGMGLTAYKLNIINGPINANITITEDTIQNNLVAPQSYTVKLNSSGSYLGLFFFHQGNYINITYTGASGTFIQQLTDTVDTVDMTNA